MLKTVIILCASALVFGADDPWAKVKELKIGSELQVYTRGSLQPLTVKMDELTDHQPHWSSTRTRKRRSRGMRSSGSTLDRAAARGR